MADQNSGSVSFGERLRSNGTDLEGGRTEGINCILEGINCIFEGIACILDEIHSDRCYMSLMSLVLFVLTIYLDLLFCYLLVVDKAKNCLVLDKRLGVIASILRSVIDLCYMVYRVRATVVALSSREYAWTPKSGLHFVVDIAVILPLPQGLVFYVIPKLNDPRVFNATALLSFIFIIQYVLRVARIYSLLKHACCIQLKYTWANLCLLILASHVVGSFWYLFAIERKATCWLEVCKHFGAHCSLYCDGTFKTTTYLKDSCSTNSPNSIPFDFGIYSDAIDSGVLDSVGLIQRISYCFWWGLQNLSSLGYNLKTSAYLWEVYFSISILIFGLVLIAALINGMQTELLSKISRPEIQKEENLKKRMGLRNDVKMLEENQRLL